MNPSKTKTLFATGAILFLIGVASTGCGWLAGGSFDSFSGERLVEGGLGIGGVVVLDAVIDGETTEARLADVMRMEIIERRQDFKIVSSSYITRTLGEDNYLALVETYRQHQSLSSQVVEKVSEDVAGRFRYLVFTIIHGDSVSTRARSSSDDEWPKTYVTTREIEATFHIYDLEGIPGKEMVWSSTVSASADRTITRRKDATRPGTLPGNEYPEPVSLEAVAIYLFDDFVLQLPSAPTARDR